jgi:hypothetical protein
MQTLFSTVFLHNCFDLMLEYIQPSELFFVALVCKDFCNGIRNSTKYALTTIKTNYDRNGNFFHMHMSYKYSLQTYFTTSSEDIFCSVNRLRYVLSSTRYLEERWGYEGFRKHITRQNVMEKAVQYGTKEVITYIAKVLPTEFSKFQSGLSFRCLFKIAAEYGRIDIMELFISWRENLHESTKKWTGDIKDLSIDSCLTAFTCAIAASSGQFETVKWLREKGCAWCAMTCTGAARGGYLEILRFARENGCDWNALVSTKAAAGGHIDILNYAHDNGGELHMTAGDKAAKHGHLNILKLLLTWGLDCRKITFVYAASYGHLHIVEYLANVVNCSYSSNAASSAAFNGHVNILQFLFENNYDFNPNISRHASTGGSLEALQWLVGHGFILSRNTCTYAAGVGRLDIVEWAHENGCGWNTHPIEYKRERNLKEIVAKAAESESLHIMKFAVKNGGILHEYAFGVAVRKGNLEMIKYLYKKGCPFDAFRDWQCSAYAAPRGSDAHRWVKKNIPALLPVRNLHM